MIEITLEQADTIALLGKYGHEGEVVDAGGSKSTVFTGDFIIDASHV